MSNKNGEFTLGIPTSPKMNENKKNIVLVIKKNIIK